MAFIDEVTIQVQAGAGGNGCISFRREKFIPKGGPNGGNGGHGGNVYLVGDRNKTSLIDFKYRPIYKASRGEHGQGQDCDGKKGSDLYIHVPLGTMVYEDHLLAYDINEDQETICIASGGRGGRGNKSFVSSVQRAPRKATPGEPGQIKELRLELRLMAHIGLVGLPNAGKSTFLASVTSATPKIHSYPFTTLYPQLGVMYYKGVSLTIADLPGLIEGAHRGVGLGHTFLRHAKRAFLLLHLVELSPEDTLQSFLLKIQTIEHELDMYGLEKPQKIVCTKMDLHSYKNSSLLSEISYALRDRDIYFISSHSKKGLDSLMDSVILFFGSHEKKISKQASSFDSERNGFYPASQLYPLWR